MVYLIKLKRNLVLHLRKRKNDSVSTSINKVSFIGACSSEFNLVFEVNRI